MPDARRQVGRRGLEHAPGQVCVSASRAVRGVARRRPGSGPDRRVKLATWRIWPFSSVSNRGGAWSLLRARCAGRRLDRAGSGEAAAGQRDRMETRGPRAEGRGRRWRPVRGEWVDSGDTLTVFTLQRTYQVPRAQIREMLRDVLSLPGIQLAGKGLCLAALDLFVECNLSYADAFHVAYLRSRGLAEIYSWDRAFDRIEGVVRLEPC